jgi:sarcosine oxidase subunit alpha
MRVSEHPIMGEIKRGKEIHIIYNGSRLKAYEGETIATALWAAGVKVARHTAKRNEPRGLFCAIGHCSDCLMTVDGIPNKRTCITLVEDGMVVEQQVGNGDWGDSIHE